MRKILPLLLTLAALVPAQAGASHDDKWATLSSQRPLVLWQHEFNSASQPEVGVCPQLDGVRTDPVASCWTRYVIFDAPYPNGFSSEPQIEVAIRWPYDGVTDFDLFVRHLPSGDEVGRSAAVDSNAESLRFSPFIGIEAYEIVVVPVQTFFPGETPRPVNVELLAQLEWPIDATGPLLPNLVSLPPANFHLSSAANLVPFPENPALSCYPEETVEDPAHPTRCLRFDQTIANVGEGPLELRFQLRGAATPGTADDWIIQRIYGNGQRTDRYVGTYEFHAAHAHVHYREFGQSILYPYDWATRMRSGDGTPARVGNKVGFCLIDVLLLEDAWRAEGNGSRNHTFPNCNVPRYDDVLVQGIDVGWADVYGWNLSDQYIDVTGLANGIYELQQVANPASGVVESRYDDNRASTVICLLEDEVFEVRTEADAADCA